MVFFVHICNWSEGDTLISEQQHQRAAMQLVQYTKTEPTICHWSAFSAHQHSFSQPEKFWHCSHWKLLMFYFASSFIIIVSCTVQHYSGFVPKGLVKNSKSFTAAMKIDLPSSSIIWVNLAKFQKIVKNAKIQSDVLKCQIILFANSQNPGTFTWQ